MLNYKISQIFEIGLQYLVDIRSNLSDIKKFYYLLGRLQGDPTEAVKGITVSNDTYGIA